MQSLLISLSRAPSSALVYPPICPCCTSTVSLPSPPEGEDTLSPLIRSFLHYTPSLTPILGADRFTSAATHTGVALSTPGGARGAGGGPAGGGGAGGLPCGAAGAGVALLGPGGARNTLSHPHPTSWAGGGAQAILALALLVRTISVGGGGAPGLAKSVCSTGGVGHTIVSEGEGAGHA